MVFDWYDNVMVYSARIIDLIKLFGKNL
jgi:glyceraldehyde-3-phosphate dehydrogenase/erythrose-4-phosphate dehydrogenase